MKEELRPCTVTTMEIVHGYKMGKVVNDDEKIRELKEIREEKIETHKGHFHRWIYEDGIIENKLIIRTYGLVEFEDGSVHKVDPECINFTDRQKTEVNVICNKSMVSEGDICKFGKNEEVLVYVTLGGGSIDSDRYVEGFYLTGKNAGHIGSFKLKELRKTDKHFDIDDILKNVYAE